MRASPRPARVERQCRQFSPPTGDLGVAPPLLARTAVIRRGPVLDARSGRRVSGSSSFVASEQISASVFRFHSGSLLAVTPVYPHTHTLAHAHASLSACALAANCPRHAHYPRLDSAPPKGSHFKN